MTKRTRRQFLQDSMLTAAAVTAPMISGAARAQSRSTNERLRCVVVGCKGRGGSHISAFTGRKDCEIAYIVDIDEKVGRQRCDSIEKRTGYRPRFVKD
ncbi:MAG: Gfo/Idh/MocA family protein, partial [Planctomycetota bacterium]